MRNVRKTSHGNSVKEVFDHCLQLVPSASIMRAHYLITSPTIFHEAAKRNIDVDLSLFLHDHPIIRFFAPNIAQERYNQTEERLSLLSH